MGDQKDYIEKMEAASADDEGATPTATPDPGDSTATQDPAEDAASPTEGEKPTTEQPPKDGWGPLLSKYKPDELKKALEDRENSKAMRREAHLRNEQAARDRAEAESLKREARDALERNRALVDTAAALADENPDLAAQMLAMFKRQTGGSNGTARHTNGAQEYADPKVAALENQLKELRTQTTQMAFGLNHSAVTAAALEAASREPILRSKRLTELGVPDKVIQRAIEAVYEQDRSDPGSINPYDPKGLRNAVEAAVKAEVAFYAQLRSANVDDWREDKRSDGKKAPPSGKGQSAGVRVAPNHQQTPPRGSMREKKSWYENRFLQATRDAATPTEEV